MRFWKLIGKASGTLKANRDEAKRILGAKFGHSDLLAAKTWDDYLICMDDRLTVDFKHLEKLVAQVAPNTPGGARQVASRVDHARGAEKLDRRGGWHL